MSGSAKSILTALLDAGWGVDGLGYKTFTQVKSLL